MEEEVGGVKGIRTQAEGTKRKGGEKLGERGKRRVRKKKKKRRTWLRGG